MPSSELKAGGFIAKNPENADFNQYWYSAKTIKAMVEAIESACDDTSRVAFISTPSVHASLTDAGLKQRSCFFDIDKKWESDSCFVYYDFNKPEDLPENLKGQLENIILMKIYEKFRIFSDCHQSFAPFGCKTRFDMVVIDPPFITREVWEKYQVTAYLLAKDKSILKVLNSTVQENKQMMKDLFGDSMQAEKFQPSIPHLVYQYNFFSNFEPEVLSIWNPEIPEDY